MSRRHGAIRHKKDKSRKPILAKLHDLIVSRYLSTVASILDDRIGSFIDANTGSISIVRSREKVLERRAKFAALRKSLVKATIFEVSPAAWVAIAVAADKHVTEKVAGLEWYPPDYDGPMEVSEEELAVEAEIVQAAVEKAGKALPFPSWLPSESCYIGLGAGVGIKPGQMQLFGLDEDDVYSATLFAQLVTADGYVWTLIEADYKAFGSKRNLPPGKFPVLHTIPERRPTGWTYPHTMAPWVVPAVVYAIGSHGATIIESEHNLSTNLQFQRRGKKLRLQYFIPPPYYAVTMKNRVIREAIRFGFPRLGKHFEFHYRFKVVGHECCKIRRGSLPLDPKLRRALDRRGYRVYESGEPSTADKQRLLDRCISEREEGEWLAILSWIRPEFEKGPADQPLIPSTRRPVRLSREPTLQPTPLPERNQQPTIAPPVENIATAAKLNF